MAVAFSKADRTKGEADQGWGFGQNVSVAGLFYHTNVPLFGLSSKATRKEPRQP